MPHGTSYGKVSTQKSFASLPAIVAFVSLEGLVAVQALLAYRDHFLTVSQMRQRGVDQGLPFVWHLGMWGDALIVSGLAAYALGRYGHQWRARSILLSLASGFISAGLFSWMYTFSGMAEAHVQGHRLTAAGLGHFFYMAIAVSVFVQFLFFTKNVSARLLKTVSALLLVHVFVGTHMVLGILTVFYPRDWYPAQPLKSTSGWITVASFALALIWRNFWIVATLNRVLRGIIKVATTALAVGMYLINQKPKSAEGYLRFLDYICGFVNFWFFFGLFLSRWRQGRNPISTLLILLVGGIYYLSRLSVWQELEIAKLVFPSDRIPDELQLKDRFTITLQVLIFLALYMFLGWVADYIMVASLCMFVIACIDFNTRRQINDRVHEYFANPKYAPSPSERSYQPIQDRRDVVRWFLFKLPHLWKEAGRASGCAAAFGISIYANVKNADRLNVLAYAILMGALILNEIVTWWWRIDRDRQLKLI